MQVTLAAQVIFSGAVLLLVYAYKGFDILLALLVAVHRKVLLRDLSFEPTVTIFIPAYNEEKIIEAKIKNCLSLDYPKDKLTIMVCSDCSSDRTVVLARQFEGAGIEVIDYRERSGKTGLINKTLPRAKGEITILTDANTIFDPGSVRSMVSCYASERVGAVLGEVKLAVPEGGRGVEKEVSYRNFEARLKFKEGIFGSAIGGFGGFYSIRTKLFELLPSNAYSNDDLLIPARILCRGLKVVFDPEAISREETGTSIEEEFHRRVRIGAGNFQAFFLLLPLLNPAVGWPFLFYLSHKVLRWFSPFLLAGVLFSSVMLARVPFFKVILILQCVVYCIAGAGAVLSHFRITLPAASDAYHFVSMNLALLFGFIRYVRGIKSAVWQSTPRS